MQIPDHLAPSHYRKDDQPAHSHYGATRFYWTRAQRLLDAARAISASGQAQDTSLARLRHAEKALYLVRDDTNFAIWDASDSITYERQWRVEDQANTASLVDLELGLLAEAEAEIDAEMWRLSEVYNEALHAHARSKRKARRHPPAAQASSAPFRQSRQPSSSRSSPPA